MSTAQRQWIWLVIGTLGFGGSLAVAQMILATRSWRLDLTPARRHVLSEHSRQILDGLDKDVKITAFLRSDDPRNPDIEDLMRRISIASRRVQHQIIDVNRNPAVARRYGVDAYGSIVVECEGRRRDFSNPTEELVIAAIVQVVRPAEHRVYFLTGHGERKLVYGDERQTFSSARAALITERYAVSEIKILAGNDIPDDASVLIIAGPRTDPLTTELLRIDSYLRRGGALLALLDPAPLPGLASLLARYGIQVSDEIVLDSENRLSSGDYLTMLVPQGAPQHPVGRRLVTPAMMSLVRPIFTVEAPSASSLVILETAPQSWRSPDLTPLRGGTREAGKGEFVAGRDTRGPVPVGVSALIRSEDGERIVGRVIVIGDADFASDAFLGYLGNRDLFLNAVNWLAGEESLIGVRPPSKAPGAEQFFVTEAQARTAFLLATVVQPLAVLALGVTVYAYRRWNS